MFIFDTKITSNWDALLLQCRKGIDEVRALQLLREFLPESVKTERAPDGIHVEPQYAYRLLAPVPDLQIHWTETARRFVINRRTAYAAHGTVREGLRALRSSGRNLAEQLVVDSEGFDVLDDHQVVNVAAMTTPKGFGLCLFDEQGAGKTVSLIFAYDLLAARAEVDQLLIVAPKSMLPEWSKDFARFRPGLYRVVSVIGSPSEKRAALRSCADVYITNFETVVTMESYFESLLRSRPDRSILAVDESFFIKSPGSKRTCTLRHLREWCRRAFVLCGTPAPNSPHDLVEQFNLVDFGVAFSGVELPLDRTDALPIVQDIVGRRGLYVRHLKSVVLPNLPSKRFHRLYVSMKPHQEKLYTGLRDRLVSDLNAISESDFQRRYASFLARKAALLQVCSNPISLVDNYEETPAKLSLLDDVLNQWVRCKGEKVVLWSFYRASLDAIVARYTAFGVVRYDGSVTDVAERSEAVRRFQEDDDIRLFVANPAAAGAGLTLHSARIAVYESLSNQAAHYFQSLDRIHRRGQERDVEYVVLLCQNTLEIVEYDRLVEKQRRSEELLGDVVVDSVTRESFLSEIQYRLEDQA